MFNKLILKHLLMKQQNATPDKVKNEIRFVTQVTQISGDSRHLLPKMSVLIIQAVALFIYRFNKPG